MCIFRMTGDLGAPLCASKYSLGHWRTCFDVEVYFQRGLEGNLPMAISVDPFVEFGHSTYHQKSSRNVGSIGPCILVIKGWKMEGTFGSMILAF